MSMFEQPTSDTTDKESSPKDSLGLNFDEEEKQLEMFRGENLRKQALQNLKEMRQRQKKSTIFGAADTAAVGRDQVGEVDEEGDIDDGTTASGVSSYDLVKSKKIDLTKTQLQ